MATLVEKPQGKLNAFQEAWRDIDRYWFSFGSATTIGLFRILLGFVNLANLILILPFFDAWYSERGFTPLSVTDGASNPLDKHFYFLNWQWELPFQVPRLDVFSYITSSPIFLTIYWVMLIAALCTTLGLWTRFSSILLAIGVVSLQHRNLLILHGGDNVVRLGALYIAISPSGKACSLDRLIGLWKGKIKPGPALVSVWPQRLVAFNVALIYFTTWWVKMDGTRWRNGTATWFPAHINEFHRFWVPPILLQPWIQPFLTYGTLLVEISMATLVFWRPARKWCLLGGLMLHGYIEYAMNIPLFAWGMCSFYIAFFDGEEISAWAKRHGQRWKKWQLKVTVPKNTPMDSGPVHALEAADAFSLITYEKAGDELIAESIEGRKPDPGISILRRAIGTWPLALIPGLRPKLLREAFPTVTKS